MDPEVRSSGPAKCSRCGMKLVAGIPDPVEFPVHVDVLPRAPRGGDVVTLRFRIAKKPHLQIIHEKLFHLFLVSGDLRFFAHEHPVEQKDGSFLWRGRLPFSGEYRLLCDFYPEGGTPQMIARTLILGIPSAPPPPSPPGNLNVKLRTEPEQPIAGQKTLLFFDLEPADGLEPYLGAWGHMLAASSDLIDMIHTHPAFDEAGPTVQFNLIFPRAGRHKIWVQFQSNGLVNTQAFDVDVKAL